MLLANLLVPGVNMAMDPSSCWERVRGVHHLRPCQMDYINPLTHCYTYAMKMTANGVSDKCPHKYFIGNSQPQENVIAKLQIQTLAKNIYEVHVSYS